MHTALLDGHGEARLSWASCRCSRSAAPERPCSSRPPAGLLADDDAAAARLLEPARAALEEKRLAYVELRDQRRAWDGLATNDEHLTMVLSLPPDPDILWKAFDAKLSNQIRKGLKSEFTIDWSSRADGFYRVMLENMRDLGTPIMAADYYQAVAGSYGDAAEILAISRKGLPAGAMFTVRRGHVVADPWASSLRSMFRYCPNQVLYWEALQRAISSGATEFDMGRSQQGSGTYRFKEQWGAKPVQLYYQYMLAPGQTMPTLAQQKQQFDLAVQVWRKLPTPDPRGGSAPASSECSRRSCNRWASCPVFPGRNTRAASPRAGCYGCSGRSNCTSWLAHASTRVCACRSTG